MKKPFSAGVNLLIYAILFLVGAAAFLPAHAHMAARRGHDAIGSEAFLLLLPLFVYLIRKCCVETYRAFRKLFDERPKNWNEWGEW